MNHCYDIEPKIPIIQMEVSRRIKTEKRTSSLVKCEGFAHCFLRLLWSDASRILATRNKEYYLEIMHRLREAIRQKSTELIVE